MARVLRAGVTGAGALVGAADSLGAGINDDSDSNFGTSRKAGNDGDAGGGNGLSTTGEGIWAGARAVLMEGRG